jgi:hypothetical protein
VNFEEYLTSKKIDAAAFEKAEPVLFHSWKGDFEQMHENSFTVQKLNLINPIRRKYQLRDSPSKDASFPVEKMPPDTPEKPMTAPAPRVARPVIKPKIN